MEAIVVCANPDEMELKVTATMRLGEWKESLRRIESPIFYDPLNELLLAIRKAIGQIEEREVMRATATVVIDSGAKTSQR